MGDAGILTEDDRVELIYGEIVAMSPIGSPHGAGVDRATRELVRITGDKAIVRVQGAVELNDYNEPQPDIVLLRPKNDFYYGKQPGPADIFLIVEIADSSLAYDRNIKAKLYAETGVPEYWLAELRGGCLFAHTEVADASYQLVRNLHRGDTLAPQLLPDCLIPIDIFLPQPGVDAGPGSSDRLRPFIGGE
jgi:Uma2 family endonuclease